MKSNLTYEEWYEKHKMKIFWSKFKMINGLKDDGTEILQESLLWRKVARTREACEKSDNPEYALKNAFYFDKQYFLEKWWNTFTRDEKEFYLIYVWGAKGDGNLYGFDWWLPYFNELGFISNKDKMRPEKPIILYRAAEPYFARGMSWTDDINMALVFQDRNHDLLGPRTVYKTTFYPESILAIVEGSIVNLSYEQLSYGKEYVVNHNDIEELKEVTLM
ncbi:hypothetical protein [Oceanobacillus chungangensis]|uniref:Uncharacterized protein n=1 Tax=Oceanobacillus chungangensis TaxID=1229152 RepID=A0A3D8PL24_9BACI|nr:hypothetical protein [Oceanobacillus chungangensis]RDW15949.1 hypothetical protein CWR45_15755 [Oceanobacillus chungangensis]